METSFSSHAPCPKIIARAALAQPSPPLTNLPCWWELASRHFSLGIVLLFFSLPHPPSPFFWCILGLFPPFFFIFPIVHAKAKSPWTEEGWSTLGLTPSLTSKILLDI